MLYCCLNISGLLPPSLLLSWWSSDIPSSRCLASGLPGPLPKLPCVSGCRAQDSWLVLEPDGCLRMSLWAPVAQGSTVLFWTKPSNSRWSGTDMDPQRGRQGWGSTKGYSRLVLLCRREGQGWRSLPDLLPLFSQDEPSGSPGFIPSPPLERWLWLLMVWMLRAVSASSARSAASIPHVPHQAGYQEPTRLSMELRHPMDPVPLWPPSPPLPLSPRLSADKVP